MAINSAPGTQRVLIANILLPRNLTGLVASAELGTENSGGQQTISDSIVRSDPRALELQFTTTSNSIIDKLYASDDIIKAMAAAEEEDGYEQLSDEQLAAVMRTMRARDPRHVTTWQLGNAPPPRAIPVVNPDIGVISTPAFSIQDVKKALTGVPLEGIHPAVVYHTMNTKVADASRVAAEFGRVGATSFNRWEIDHLWFEAALSTNQASQITPWGIDRINAPAVWRRGNRGRGVRLAIVDSGTGPHIDLPQPVAGATFVPGTNSYHDGSGHGTHVAGTAVAMDNDKGVVGVAPQADLLVARVLGSNGRGNDTWIANGMTWAVNQGAKVLNLSLGGSRSDTVLRAVDYAETKGAVVCAAAGNGYCSPVIYPAAYERCVAVAATSRSDARCSFSNCGPQLDVSAPGCGILSTVVGGGYEEWGGTSMATPHVSGVVALMFAANPNFTPEEIRQRLRNTARRLGAVNEFGSGLVQADKAVPEATIPPDPCEPDPCSPPSNDAESLARRIAIETIALTRAHSCCSGRES